MCSTNNISSLHIRNIESYATRLEEKGGHTVYLPHRDLNFGKENLIKEIDICKQKRKAIEEADQIYVYCNLQPEEILFDMGMAFMAKKIIKIISVVDLYNLPKENSSNLIEEWETKGAI